MSELISRLKEIIEKYNAGCYNETCNPFESCTDCVLKQIREVIESQPPAESEIKRGKWIRYEDTHENSVKYICPFCGDYTAFRDEIAESTVNGNYIYCRHCGAKNGEDQ